MFSDEEHNRVISIDRTVRRSLRNEHTQTQTHRVLQGHPSPDSTNGLSKEEVTSIFGKVIKEPGGKTNDVSYLCDFENEALLDS